MADKPESLDESSDQLPKTKESLQNASNSSEAPENKEPKKIPSGILKKPKEVDSDAKIRKVFEIPDMLKKTTRAKSLSDDSFVITSLKNSWEDKPRAHTSKEKTELAPVMKEDTKPAPEKAISSDSSHERHLSVETKSSEEDSEEPLESDESSIESAKQPAPKRKRSSLAERFRKKRSSIVQFFTGSKKKGSSKAKPRRSSFNLRKFLALEKELTIDSINKRVTNIFHLEPLGSKESVETEEDEEETSKRVHLSSAMACMFIISAMTGSAMTNLPFSLKESNWFGVFFNLLLGLNGVFAGLCTGWSWTILEEAWPEYSEYSRIPYQDIAFRAAGTWVKYIVAICVDISILGSCGSYIIIIASCVEDIVENFHFCYTMVIVTVVLTPIAMFNSYRNIKIIGIMDVFFSFLFTLMMIISFFLDKPRQGIATYTHPTLKSVAMSLAGFSYAYGLGAILPSIMVDMADKNMFSQTVVTAYMASMVIYLLLPIIGYAAYGDKTPGQIIHSILHTPLHNYAIAVNVIQILQLATTFIVAILPTLHAFEVRFNCPDRFGLGRFLVRLLIMLVVLLVILGMPYLPNFMALVGATTMNLLTFILPPVFYVCLVYRTKSKAGVKKRTINKKEWCVVAEIILMGTVVGILSTFMSSERIQDSHEKLYTSCYESVNSFPEGTNWLHGGKNSSN